MFPINTQTKIQFGTVYVSGAEWERFPIPAQRVLLLPAPLQAFWLLSHYDDAGKRKTLL